MNLAAYLMMDVTPLHKIVIAHQYSAGDANREAVAKRRAEDMMTRYYRVMHGKILSSQQIGDAVGVTKPLIGLRKLEQRGKVRVHHTDCSRPGRRQHFWEWLGGPT